MVIAVIAIGMMEVAIDQVIDVVSVGNGRVPAVGSVLVTGGVSAAIVACGAACWIGGVHLQRVFVHMILMRGVQVAVVQVVGVTVVLDRGMAAALAVLMGMILVNFVLSWHLGASWGEDTPNESCGCEVSSNMILIFPTRFGEQDQLRGGA